MTIVVDGEFCKDLIRFPELAWSIAYQASISLFLVPRQELGNEK